MPKVALADTIDDWEQLLRAAYAELKELHVHLVELRTALDRIQQVRC